MRRSWSGKRFSYSGQHSTSKILCQPGAFRNWRSGVDGVVTPPGYAGREDGDGWIADRSSCIINDFAARYRAAAAKADAHHTFVSCVMR